MKLTIALLAIILTFSLGACSTSSDNSSKKVMLGTCAPGDAGKPAILLKNSYAEEGRVVRIAH